MKVWVLMRYGEYGDVACWGVVTDQKTADGWAVQGEGNTPVAFELDALPKGFRPDILRLD